MLQLEAEEGQGRTARPVLRFPCHLSKGRSPSTSACRSPPPTLKLADFLPMLPFLAPFLQQKAEYNDYAEHAHVIKS